MHLLWKPRFNRRVFRPLQLLPSQHRPTSQFLSYIHRVLMLFNLFSVPQPLLIYIYTPWRIVTGIMECNSFFFFALFSILISVFFFFLLLMNKSLTQLSVEFRYLGTQWNMNRSKLWLWDDEQIFRGLEQKFPNVDWLLVCEFIHNELMIELIVF